MPLISKMSYIFRFIFIFLIYLIIYFSLKIMYKDMKEERIPSNDDEIRGYDVAMEVLQISSKKSPLKVGTIIPVRDNLTIGRGDKNTLILYDQYVSKKHAKIYFEKNEYVIKDLGSTNGVIINDEVIEGEMYLEIGDIIQIGENVFKIIG
ncbi:FHA domain-containing protein [Clostridium sediminicola]|uniref:FHA domain-containing protein n=1 Tax=Clostridium sediminicola TaxID=3114879 RepID=UPI0031F229BD